MGERSGRHGPGWASRAGLAVQNAAAALWFVVIAAGQLVFSAYVVIHYAGSWMRGDMAAWDKTLIHAIIAGDGPGNAALVVHLALASLITVAGVLQLTPQVRRAWPAFHRATGRVFLAGAVIAALAGLYMIWARGLTAGFWNAVGISFNAGLILLCAAMALHHARARRIDVHRVWATRLWLMVSAGWFFRIALMLWILLNGGKPVGVGENFDGPMIVIFSFGEWIVPLVLYEMHRRAQASPAPAGRWAMAATLLVVTAGMGAGIGVAIMGMWLPHMTV